MKFTGRHLTLGLREYSMNLFEDASVAGVEHVKGAVDVNHAHPRLDRPRARLPGAEGIVKAHEASRGGQGAVQPWQSQIVGRPTLLKRPSFENFNPASQVVWTCVDLCASCAPG